MIVISSVFLDLQLYMYVQQLRYGETILSPEYPPFPLHGFDERPPRITHHSVYV